MPWDKQFEQADVLDRAMRTFWTHGYGATSVQMLVERTGINRGSLYASFGDKRALFIDVLGEYVARRDRLFAELRVLASPREAILRAFERLSPRDGEVDAGSGCLLVNTALELAAHDREIGAFIAGSQRSMEAFLVDRIAAGQVAGEFRTSIDADAAGALLLATLLGTRVLMRSRPDPALLRTVIDAALAQLD